MDSGSKEMLVIEPSELCFPFETKRQISCSMRLTNQTDKYTAFKVQTTTPKWYSVQPTISIVPPGSYCDVIVTMQARSEAPPGMRCNDKFLVLSTVVTEGTKIDDLTNDMFQGDATDVVDRVILRVVLQPPSTVQEGFGDGSKELLGIEPSELRFPFETKKQISCSMQLKNKTDKYIAFKVLTSRPKKYTVKPNISIMPPGFYCDVIVTMQAQSVAPPDMQCNDKFLVLSTMVTAGTTTEDLTNDMFEDDATDVVNRVKLRVVLQPPSPLWERGPLPRPCWSDAGNINYTGSLLHNMALQYLEEITNNFSNEGILGRGGFGVVYKGVLGNGKMIAVKKLVQSMSTSQEQFENEVNLLMKLKHPNIVQLVGYCYETQHLHNHHEGKSIFAWKTECLLCLEYLPKGSLEKYISDASSGLDWATRYKIIEGISYGLQYLHEQADGPIIHLDLKPGNILLDEDMIAKVTDFGLSRLYDEKQTIHTSVAFGTLGYMPPEYLRGIITPMSDIFSLGVIIMEIITGHRDYPYDIRKSSADFINLELQKWRNVLQKESGYISLETDCKEIKRCIQIGLICVNPERTKRPTMKKIVDMLQGLESMDWYISNELSSHDIEGGTAV